MAVLQALSDINEEFLIDRFGHTAELHVKKLLAVKRTVVNDSKWPIG
jgi:hypothetical protein